MQVYDLHQCARAAGLEDADVDVDVDADAGSAIDKEREKDVKKDIGGGRRMRHQGDSD